MLSGSMKVGEDLSVIALESRKGEGTDLVQYDKFNFGQFLLPTRAHMITFGASVPVIYVMPAAAAPDAPQLPLLPVCVLRHHCNRTNHVARRAQRMAVERK